MTAEPYQAARISSQVIAKTISGKAQGTGSRSLSACPGHAPRGRGQPLPGDAVVDTTRLVTPLRREQDATWNSRGYAGTKSSAIDKTAEWGPAIAPVGEHSSPETHTGRQERLEGVQERTGAHRNPAGRRPSGRAWRRAAAWPSSPSSWPPGWCGDCEQHPAGACE